MEQTTNYQFPWPDPTDPADGSAHIGNLAKAVDSAIFGTIWTPLNSRVTALENRPVPSQITAQNGRSVLNPPHVAIPTSWLELLTCGTLAAGTWLILAAVEVFNTGNGPCGVVTRLQNMAAPGTTLAAITTPNYIELDITGGADWYPAQARLSATVVLATPAEVQLQVQADTNGRALARANTNILAQPGTTRIDWIRLA